MKIFIFEYREIKEGEDPLIKTYTRKVIKAKTRSGAVRKFMKIIYKVFPKGNEVFTFGSFTVSRKKFKSDYKGIKTVGIDMGKLPLSRDTDTIDSTSIGTMVPYALIPDLMPTFFYTNF